MHTLYLVRHGQSEENARGVYLGPDQSLTALGHKQAELLGERFTHLPLAGILASPFRRAQETGAGIARSTGHSVETHEALREWEIPKELYGRALKESEVEAFFDARRKQGSDPHWRYNTEESFAEVALRAQGILQELIARPEACMAAVTHAKFTKCLIGTALFGEAFSPVQFQHIYENLVISNTGITVLTEKEGRFQVRMVNDHAHVGDTDA